MKRLRAEYVDAKTMNDILEWTNGRKRVFRYPTEWDNMGMHVYIDDRKVELRVSCVYKGRVATYILRKDEKEVYSTINGGDAFNLISREYSKKMGMKIPRWMEETKYRAQAILAYRNGTDRKRIDAYGYDMTKAYNWGLSQPMPDTSKLVGMNRIVGEGEVGFFVSEWEVCPYSPRLKASDFTFSADGADALYMADPGTYATWIFKQIESPFKAFSERWWKRSQVEDPFAKQKAKDMVNFAVGYLQRVNPFLRCAVIENCNRRILSLMDEHTLYVNTDSIISSVPRPDLKIGKAPGEWKLEHEGPFAHIGFSYQWGYGKDGMHYRSVPQNWFEDGFDILTDELPGEEANRYYYDAFENKVKENKR